jgi:hypothetical protein
MLVLKLIEFRYFSGFILGFFRGGEGGREEVVI